MATSSLQIVYFVHDLCMLFGCTCISLPKSTNACIFSVHQIFIISISDFLQIIHNSIIMISFQQISQRNERSYLFRPSADCWLISGPISSANLSFTSIRRYSEWWIGRLSMRYLLIQLRLNILIVVIVLKLSLGWNRYNSSFFCLFIEQLVCFLVIVQWINELLKVSTVSFFLDGINIAKSWHLLFFFLLFFRH